MSEDFEIVASELPNDGAAVEHAHTYARFMSALKWGFGTVAVLLMVLAIFLVR